MLKKKKLPDEFNEWQSKYSLVKSPAEKIECLEGMLKHIPHGDEFNKVRSHISRRLKDLRIKTARKHEQALKIKQARGVKFNDELTTLGLIGPPNTGKTYLINHYCSTDYSSTEVPFETKHPALGVAKFNDTLIQFYEVPSSVEARYVQALQRTNLILITGDFVRFREVLDKHGIRVKSLLIDSNNPPTLSELWTNTGLIRVYPKGEDKPVVLKRGASVKDYLSSIHSSWISRFKSAIVNGASVKFPNQSVNINHKLADKDVIEVKLS